MSMVLKVSAPLRRIEPGAQPKDKIVGILQFMELLGISDIKSASGLEKLPFTGNDATAGSENEWQVAVVGSRQDVDLAQTLEASCFFQNIATRVVSGDALPKKLAELENYLETSHQIWENSWVRLPLKALSAYAKTILDKDLLADKRNCSGPSRSDRNRFFIIHQGEPYLRIPISYLLKLSMAQIISLPGLPILIGKTGEQLMAHFLNDNTSPETHAFYITTAQEQSLGQATAQEILLRYLLSQLLVQYANDIFALKANGQKAMVYCAPHPPIRQKQLNALISDTFYRELFMSPCLSGWARGEAKQGYMALCHEVLSRSQLNTLSKLKEAGIINNNLVVLPSTSNISLANNGIHVSLGSRCLSQLLKDKNSRLSAKDEKYYGDLVIKIQEHFLPLFVGTYTAAPYRLDFTDFHPERVLGFLPHELDYTHLRMIWRRWKGKAQIKVFGHPLTPFGPEWLDRAVSGLLRLKGDVVHDFRLIDYLVSLLSTDTSPSLNGRLDNDLRLKADLSDMGVFDRRMPLYMLMRLRQYAQMGYSGFEARHYSLFEKAEDIQYAIDLQHLTTLLAYQYIFNGQVSHADIPDTPTAESERRQFFFGTAIGIPTFYVRQKNANQFLARIIKKCQNTRSSHRYPGYIRVPARNYHLALIQLLRRDGARLIEMLKMEPVVHDLEQRIQAPEKNAAAHRITRRIIGNSAKKALQLRSHTFNQAAEQYYRDTLRIEQMTEACAVFLNGLRKLDGMATWRRGYYNQSLLYILNGRSAADFLCQTQPDLLAERLSTALCEKLIHLLLLVIHVYQQQHGEIGV